MKYRAYPVYKDSGVEWLGEVPEHWNIKKLKHVATALPSNVDKKFYDGEQQIRLCNYTDVYYHETITADLSFMIATASQEQIKRFTLRKDDVIITKDSEDPEDIAIPAYIPEDLPGVICGYHLALIRSRDSLYGRFLKSLLDSRYSRSVFSTKANGLTRYGLGTYAINNFSIPLPPIIEQTQIATFLDRETQKIDTLIEKQERLIELLQEKRQAVISHAVTKGLDPNVKMKDSGVEWLGAVPEHWDITEIRHVASSIGGGTPNKDNEAFWNGDIPWVSPKDMKVDFINDSADKITTAAVHYSSAKYVPIGSVLIVVRGMILLHSVPVALSQVKLTINQDMKGLIPCSRLSGEYLLYLLKGFRGFILNLVDSSAHGTKCLRTELFERMTIGLPSHDEQKSILVEVKNRMEQIDKLIAKTTQAITLLKEHRTALISAAVTGKIDVRPTAPNIPSALPMHETTALIDS